MISDQAPRAGCRPRVRAHVEQELGPIKQVFHGHSPGEVGSGALSIDVLHVAAAIDRPVHTLVTAGMSDRAMNTGGGSKAPRYLELMMTLPRDWKLDGITDSDVSYWPIRTLVSLASQPHLRGSALKWGDTVSNDGPFAPGIRQCAVIIAPSLLVPKEFYALETGDRRIEFYAAIPLYKEEVELRQQQGMEQLLTTMLEHRVNDLVDLKRRNVARKRFGFF